MGSILSYVFDLGFPSNSPVPPLEADSGKRGKPYLGQGRPITWDLYGWVAIATGIFLRSCLKLPSLKWQVDALTWQSFLAALVVSFAVFGPFMRWLNSGRKKPGLQQFAAPLTFGFFLSLTQLGVTYIYTRI